MESIEIYNMPFGKLKKYCKGDAVCKGVIANGNYKCKFSNDEYNIYMGYALSNIDKTYRAVQMKKGLYLGHNMGNPCDLHIDRNNIFLYMKDSANYEKVFWGFAIKYIFTMAALEKNVLHIKGLLLKDHREKLYLLLGKGQSGKTTLGIELEKKGYKVVSNTHCFVKGEYVWGINSWIRLRSGVSQKYLIPSDTDEVLDGKIEKCYVVDWNNQGEFKIDTSISDLEKYLYIRNFVAAIGNYDLKEEVWDYTSQNRNIKEKINLFCKEDEMIKSFMANTIQFIDIDSRNENCLNKFIEILER